MADILVPVATGCFKRLADMGDGTWAEVVQLATEPTIEIGSVGLIAGGALGEVQASPTANTLLDRLKQLLLASPTFYASPNGNRPQSSTTLDSLFSDDFGGSAIDSANWDVLDGGLGANVDLGNGVLTQAAIGSGTTGITDSVSASALTVVMGTTNGAERWYLSKQVFAGKEDILVLLSRSQANAINHIFIGMVEVDPTTLVPLLNPNLANEFTNSGGCQFGLTATAAAFQARAVGDRSAAIAVGAIGAAGTPLSTGQEFLIEIDSRDIIVSSSLVNSVAAKAAGGSRVSTQCPNDKKLYKLVMRFKNVGVPTATSVVIERVLVINNYEQRVQISTAEGDQLASKALAVNVTTIPTVTATVSTTTPNVAASATGGSTLNHKLIAAGSTNGTLVAAGTKRLLGGSVCNVSASVRYLKFYNKATAPTVGTDTPIATIALQPNTTYSLLELAAAAPGAYFSLGIGYGITGAAADNDMTAITAGDVLINVLYI